MKGFRAPEIGAMDPPAAKGEVSNYSHLTNADSVLLLRHLFFFPNSFLHYDGRLFPSGDTTACDHLDLIAQPGIDNRVLYSLDLRVPLRPKLLSNDLFAIKFHHDSVHKVLRTAFNGVLRNDLKLMFFDIELQLNTGGG